MIKSRILRWAGHVARMEEGRSAFKILTGKPTGKRPLRRPRRSWEDNIRLDLEEIGVNTKRLFINYVRVPKVRGVGKNLYIDLLWGVKPILT